MLALNVSIPCQTRGLPSCEVATWNLLRKSCNETAAESCLQQGDGKSGPQRLLFVVLLDVAGFVLRRLNSCAAVFTSPGYYRNSLLGSERASPTQ